MPLPFLAGLAAGAALALLYTKKDKVKKIVNSPKVKENLQKGREFSQKTINNMKDKFEEFSPKIKRGAKRIFADFKDNVGELSQKISQRTKTTKGAKTVSRTKGTTTKVK
ncbi:hypothetical protein [Campylobacter troglodytis]|uniref:hypothetical protein n=1 Tax=Campylobacter troglodytis TaxID=654363 RepID=UPI00115B5A87|nr:hypothetical protein [Campylobacter troglodytis]TQR60363.1 hypothetical protein DMC01_06045 [Campylobacter troglodytis]